MVRRLVLLSCVMALTPADGKAQQPPPVLPSSAGTAYVIRAGRLIDPETGIATANQMIAVKDGRVEAIGANVTAPAGAETIDLSQYSVLPGLVDAHNHLALTYKKIPENDVYYYTYIQESTALRAIQAASNGMQMLSFGFTVVRDLGNNGLYADTALRVAIEQGWIPGPTIINSGIIIGGMGGQFFPTPEMARLPAVSIVMSPPRPLPKVPRIADPDEWWVASRKRDLWLPAVGDFGKWDYWRYTWPRMRRTI